MAKLVVFNSHDEFFRCPQGAIPCGSNLTLKILVSKAVDAYGVTVRLWVDSSEKLLNMTKTAYFDHTPYGDFFDVYSIEISRNNLGLYWYQFIINTPYKPLYACNMADGLGGNAEICDRFDDTRSFQVTVCDSEFEIPDWAVGGIMYQIFPDRFYRAEGKYDTTGKRIHENWDDLPDWQVDRSLGYYPANDFFGGNLKGITEKLDYIKSLGVTAIYLNPIFKAYSNHRYDTGDYEAIDSMLGTIDDFRELCERAESKNIKIILDGVFSHTGSNSRYFNKNGEYSELGAYQSKASPYYDWYDFESYPDKYDSWWGVWSLPCVKEMTPSYIDYIITGENSIIKKWLKAGASGWRLDVADELPDEFIKMLRKSAKEEKPDSLIIGEVWEDASNKISYGARREFLYGNELDTVMNYPLKNLTAELLLNKIDGEAFCRGVLSLRENYPAKSFYSSMNFLSTHDTERIITKLCGIGENVSRETFASFTPDEETYVKAIGLHKLAALIIYSLPGQPTIYYGDEVGIDGGTDPFNRKTFPWGKENMELLNWYTLLGKLHASPPFIKGNLTLNVAGSLLSVKRKEGKSYRYVLINYNDETVETLLDETYFKNTPELLADTGGGLQFQERDNGYYILIPPYSGAVFGVEL